MIKSPLNYVGGKHKLLPQILPIFPDCINNFVDLFSGGCNVVANAHAASRFANDINYYIIDIYKTIQDMPIEDILYYINDTVSKFQLTKEDEAAYKNFRDYYNNGGGKSPLNLYILGCYSFNNQFRFNNSHEYNSAFGRRCFNDNMRSHLIAFKQAISDIHFSTHDFVDYDFDSLKQGDFLYADPPYLSTCCSYNDGKRGFRGWSTKDEIKLYECLQYLSGRNVKWALSNNMAVNPLLESFVASEKLTVHEIQASYRNSNFYKKDRERKDCEVLITNY